MSGHTADRRRRRSIDLVLADVLKIATLPASGWALAVALLLSATLAALDLAGARVATGTATISVREIGHLVLAPAYGALALAVFAASSEYAQGQIRLTLLAEPSRPRLLAAKVAAVLTAALTAAVVCVAPRLVGTGGFDPTRALAWIGAAGGLALIGWAIALAVRNAVIAFAAVTAAAIADWTGLIPPGIAAILPHGSALGAIGMSPHLAGVGSALVSLLVLGAWCVATLAIAGALFLRRDA